MGQDTPQEIRAMSDANDQHLIGFTIGGKYAIRRVIGVGGFGAVYEGVHTEIGKRVAIKVISGALAHSGEVAARFRREARAASAVESEHIVHVFDVGQDPVAGLFMVMELLVGEDLAQRLERERRIPVDQATMVTSQIARALIRAHAAGVVHRDLKPGNIFLCERADGSLLVKVLDFGISKMLNDEQGAKADPALGRLTRVGSVVGTPQYMSPEQAQGLSSVDQRTDLWSLGAIFYEMLAGQPAYDLLQTYEQTIVHIVVNAPPPLHVRAPWVPHALSQVVHECLEHSPEIRIRDAASLLRRLREVSAVPIRDLSGALPTVESEALGLRQTVRQEPAGSSREVPSALGSGPTTLNFDLSSQPHIPLSAYGVQSAIRPQQASSNAPVAFDPPRLELTESGIPVFPPSAPHISRKPSAAPLYTLLGALGLFALVVGGLAARTAFSGRPTPVAAPVRRAPVVVQEVPAALVVAPEEPVADAGPPQSVRHALPHAVPNAATPAPWRPSHAPVRPEVEGSPPPVAPRSKDRRLGDVGHTDDF